MSRSYTSSPPKRHTACNGTALLFAVSIPVLGPTQPPVQWVPGVLSPGLKRGRAVTLATNPHLVLRSGMSRSYTSSPPSAFVACSGTGLASGEKTKSSWRPSPHGISRRRRKTARARLTMWHLLPVAHSLGSEFYTLLLLFYVLKGIL
jgi:hypothetical protein